MHTLDPRDPAGIESFLLDSALRRRAADSLEHVDTDHFTPFTEPGVPRAATVLAVIDLGGDRAPYSRHRVTLRRGYSTRLHVEIESFLPHDNLTPARIEMGPVAKCVRRLLRLNLTPATLHQRCHLPDIEDWFDFRGDFRTGLAALGLGHPVPKIEPVPQALRTPADHGLPIDFVGE